MFCYSQNLIIATYKKELGNYKSRMVNDSLKNEKSDKSLSAKMKSFNKNYHLEAQTVVEKLDFKFTTNLKECSFIVNEAGLLKDDKSYNSALITGINTSGNYFSNSINKESIHQKAVFGETFLVKKPFLNVEWKLENETKKIGKFNCFKATAILVEINPKNIATTYPIICWYTTEIPTNNLGPAGFNGLPGLIVSLQKGNTFLNLTSVEFKKETLKIEKPIKGIVAENEKEYEKIAIKLYRQMIGKRRD
jgi:GLPGLI family protein